MSDHLPCTNCGELNCVRVHPDAPAELRATSCMHWCSLGANCINYKSSAPGTWEECREVSPPFPGSEDELSDALGGGNSREFVGPDAEQRPGRLRRLAGAIGRFIAWPFRWMWNHKVSIVLLLLVAIPAVGTVSKFFSDNAPNGETPLSEARKTIPFPCSKSGTVTVKGIHYQLDSAELRDGACVFEETVVEIDRRCLFPKKRHLATTACPDMTKL